MFIKFDGEFNRWRIFKNENTDEIEFHYEGMCPVVREWVTISKLVFDDEIYDQIKYLYKKGDFVEEREED